MPTMPAVFVCADGRIYLVDGLDDLRRVPAGMAFEPIGVDMDAQRFVYQEVTIRSPLPRS